MQNVLQAVEILDLIIIKIVKAMDSLLTGGGT